MLRYLIPIAICLAVHWLALHTWFYLDDFAWLGLRLQVHSATDLAAVLFKPAAQGTVRVIPERLFFLVFSTLFGLNAYAFKAWIFATQFANIVLVVQIAQRITGSPFAAIVAASLWTANAGLAIALGWTSAYNEIAFAFCTLLAFRFFLLAIDTGDRRYWIAQWIVFLLSFGVLELTVTYPALAAGYAFCCAREHLRRALWLFIPAFAYAAAHFLLVPRSSDPSYAMHFDVGLFATFWRYWSFALAGFRQTPVDWRPGWLGITVALAITAGLVAFTVSHARARDWRPLFLAAWFAAVLAPVVPLKEHFTEYYITVPSIGLAILASWAFAQARVPGAILTAAYLILSVTDVRTAARFYLDFSHKLKRLVTAIAQLPAEDRSKTILLEGVDNQMFWLGLSGNPLQLAGVNRFLLAPGSERAIDPHPEWGGLSKYTISSADAEKLLARQQAILVHADGTVKTPPPGALPTHIEVADPNHRQWLGPTWHPAEAGFRWMPLKASVRMSGGKALEVTGYSPAAILTAGPLTLTVKANQKPIGTTRITKPDEAFTLIFPLPERQEVEIELEIDRATQVPGDPRQLGIIIRTLTVL